ncbi:MAG: CYTH domain-containing protein [Balneolaceae bacterium]
METHEIESKFELSKEDFVRVKEFSQVKELKEQLNIYFDFNNSLSEKAITFRVRVNGTKNPKMTLKIPIDSTSGAREVIEVEQELNSEYDARNISVINISKDLPQEFKKYLRSLNLDYLYKVGEMRTNRWVTSLNNKFEIEMDEVLLPDGREFFEVEIENDEYNYRKKAEAILKSITPNLIPSHCSKYERFTDAILKLSSDKEFSI